VILVCEFVHMSKGALNKFLRGNTTHRLFKIVTFAVTSCVLVTMITFDASASSGGRGTVAINQLNLESTRLREPWYPQAKPATAPNSAPVTSASSVSSTDTDAPASTTTEPAPTTTSTQPSSPKPLARTSKTPIIGVLGVSGNHFLQERAAGIGAVTINVGWNEAEPSPGTFSSSYLSSLRAEIATARSARLSVVLDPGLQYPPSWVFSLPGGTRFVDQYGDVFTGSEDSGNNIVNGVTDLAVRYAEGSYLAWLGSQIQPGEIIGIREGGGPLGELSYPSNDYDGHTNSFWAYDASTQATSPVPGWTPGTGPAVQAQAFLDAYNATLNSYGSWLNGELGADFATKVLVLLPGWGERPVDAANEVASLLTLNMPEFNEGLDWPDLLDSLPDASNSVAYTTWLDAPTYGQTPQLEDPANYIASLAATYHLKLGGENTGDGNIATVTLCFDRAEELGYYIVQWMNEPQLISSSSRRHPSGPTLVRLGSMGAKLLGRD
jgi:hypothetical protein